MSYQQCTRFRFRTTLDFIANISGVDQTIDERKKTALATTIFPRLMKTICRILVH